MGISRKIDSGAMLVTGTTSGIASGSFTDSTGPVGGTALVQLTKKKKKK
jgi:hypothetical protein